jgi:hypothetical protein
MLVQCNLNDYTNITTTGIVNANNALYYFSGMIISIL